MANAHPERVNDVAAMEDATPTMRRGAFTGIELTKRICSRPPTYLRGGGPVTRSVRRPSGRGKTVPKPALLACLLSAGPNPNAKFTTTPLAQRRLATT